ncbi:MAG: hypothetical protein C4530_03065 [Desulfobacteraceae bacterium]|nr:MAG: hypothetical protein C4530_03065 [Desulfobacteraceae bacterium]
MKKKLFLFSIFLFGSSFGLDSHASWFIDTYKYQTSVHGDMSCLDCHEGVSEQEPHPDPEDVNRELSDFFDRDLCLRCHEDIAGNLEDGIHGSLKVDDPQKYQSCIDCHNPHEETAYAGTSVPIDLAELSEEDAQCMTCHGIPEESDEPETDKIISLCFHCHALGESAAKEMTKAAVPLIDSDRYSEAPHAELACTVCHLDAASFPHSGQALGVCARCHPPHDERVAHASHFSVSCEACHLQDIQPVRNAKTKEIGWKVQRKPEAPLNIHQMTKTGDTAACKRCHSDGNNLGAAAMVLPPKSILCMPCHAATFSAGDATTLLSLLIFLAGIVLMFSYVLTGSVSGHPHADWLQKLSLTVRSVFSALFSKKIQPIARAFFLDVLLQRRLYRQSPNRWAIHGLIFFPFVIRFLWGMFALVGSLIVPEWGPIQAMLDKNHAITGFLFDATGLMILIGTAFALVRGKLSRPKPPEGLPQKDYVALALIGGIVVVGFVLEGMRIAMTGRPSGSAFAFLGFIVSQLFSSGSVLNEVYGYIWYLHAVLTGAFVAYIPFSRLSHMIVAPVTLSIRSAAEEDHSDAHGG